MKWLSLLFSFFLGKFNLSSSSRQPSFSIKEGVNILFDELAYRSRKPAMFTLGAIFCIALLCGGFFMGVMDLTAQYDAEGFVQATASTVTGFALAIVALGVFAWIFKFAWPGVKEKEKEEELETQKQPAGLEQALTLLVMDFIKEREMNREERRQRHPVPSVPPTETTPRVETETETPPQMYQH